MAIISALPNAGPLLPLPRPCFAAGVVTRFGLVRSKPRLAYNCRARVSFTCHAINLSQWAYRGLSLRQSLRR